MKVVVMGLGYIGLPTALMFAQCKAEVLGVDTKKEVIEHLKKGQAHIEEPGAKEYLKAAIEQGNFHVQRKPTAADVFIIAVPTPNKQDMHGSCDLSYVGSALEAIKPFLAKGNTIIIESTIAPKTTENYVLPEIEALGFKVGEDIFLVHCPERVLPGKIFSELVNNNRMIGGVTEKCTAKGIDIYRLFVKGELIPTTAAVAELAKLMENSYRMVNIAIANELVTIGNGLEINALEVIAIANKHPRVNIHQPGPGVGGHCLAVDPSFIIANAPTVTPLLQTATKINQGMPEFIFQKIVALMQQYNGQKLSILGIAYKGNIDDIRESPAIKVIDLLRKHTNYEMAIYDPYVDYFKDKKLAGGLKEATAQSDLLVILCDHDEFKQLSDTCFDEMQQAIVFDTKNILLPHPKIKQHVTLGNLYESNKMEYCYEQSVRNK